MALIKAFRSFCLGPKVIQLHLSYLVQLKLLSNPLCKFTPTNCASLAHTFLASEPFSIDTNTPSHILYRHTLWQAGRDVEGLLWP